MTNLKMKSFLLFCLKPATILAFILSLIFGYFIHHEGNSLPIKVIIHVFFTIGLISVIFDIFNTLRIEKELNKIDKEIDSLMKQIKEKLKND